MNETQKNYIRIAREQLISLSQTIPAVTENYKRVNDIIAELEALLGY